MSDTHLIDEIDNNKCILVEFVNEESTIQTGFLCWIPNYYIDRIDEIIEKKEVIAIDWPDVDPAPVSVMKSKLKNAVFKKYPVIILAQGEWTQMREEQGWYEKEGTPDPPQKTRRRIKKKFFGDDSDNDNETSNGSNQPKHKKPCNESTKLLAKQISRQTPPPFNIVYEDSDENSSIHWNKNEETDVDPLIMKNNAESKNETDVYSTQNANTVVQSFKENDNIEDKSDKDMDMETSMTSTTCGKNKYIDLKRKYDNLKNEYDKMNINFENLKESDERHKQNNKYFTKKFTEMEKEINTLLSENKTLKSVEKSSQKDWNTIVQLAKKYCTKFEDNLEIITKHSVEQSFDEDNQKEKSKLPVPAKILKENQSNFQEYKKALDDNDTDKQDKKVGECDEKKSKVTKDAKENKKKGDESEFQITKEMRKHCRTDSISNCMSDLLEKVFTPKELATCSVKGSQSNANIKKGLQRVKPALDENRLRAVKKWVLNKFGNSRDNRVLVNAATRNKLSDYSKRMKEQNFNEDEKDDEEEHEED